ncbi:DUF4156 domain-containing protein [Sedimenticola thiotaurini]|uniref:DUF4156 domain-containing protein n=1 Tax=Sedimenticola thiotaurini TaxID=1543721 RepID=A0A0F7K4N5_9GAMM|nr:DUF4156 domain-containing protein [Sedimenticola thiotaurini]AKH21938.1 hypothetical protein AAY24_18100 [Sedimenticola thiotaurini]
MNRLLSLFLLTVALLASGCSWVKPTPEGQRVRVLNAQEVVHCRELGTTTVSLLDRIAGIERNRQTVEAELQTLARNAAADIGGDTVVPASDIINGKQRFTIYQCDGVSR